MQLADHARTLAAQITFVRRSDPHVELAVVTDDRPGTLARICATFSRHKVKVVSAQIYAWTDPDGRRRVLDLFWVRSGQDPELVIELLPRLTDTLTSLVQGEVNEMDLVRAKRNEARWSLRPSPAVPIQVRIDNNGATRHTIMEVITKDRADLLFWISESIYRAGLSIDLAKIHTEGVRVTDVFYVCTADGTKVADEKLLDELKQQITQRLQDLEEGSEQ
jgi:[protein-PII] uridylyltransferase